MRAGQPHQSSEEIEKRNQIGIHREAQQRDVSLKYIYTKQAEENEAGRYGGLHNQRHVRRGITRMDFAERGGKKAVEPGDERDARAAGQPRHSGSGDGNG